jgi:hypothetical protein
MMTAREQGKVDHAAAKSSWENPYKAGTMDHYNWYYSWLEAEANEVLQVIEEK